MKNFFSSFFGALAALIVFVIGASGLGFLLLVGIAASSAEKPAAVEKGAWLVFDFTGNITDAPEQMEGLDELMGAFGGGDAPQRLQLRAVVRALRAAAKDDAVGGLFLTGQFNPDGYGSGYAALKEVRDAIAEFRAAGKPVKAYFTLLTTREYYLGSAADDLVLDPYGALAMPGLASRPMFLAGAFEKFGIGVQVTRVGKYKSAIEPYTRRDMSPENRAQVQKLLDDIWAELAGTVAGARGLKPEEFQQLMDTEGLIRGEDAVKHKLVDRAAYYDEVQAELKQKTGVKSGSKSFKQVDIKSYARLVSPGGLEPKRQAAGRVEAGGGGRVAIVYAEGPIMDGEGDEEGIVFGETFAKEIRKLRQDDNVKAIVLRVNSPGGSASASEAIVRELALARKEKPVVVSMGSVAASGGYWIATSADRIFAEEATITGSIGVFGMFLNVQGLANEKLGLTFETVKTGKFADAMSVTRPKTEDELAVMQRMVDWIYDQFLTKVAEARKLDRAAVHEIAQGRVWSGVEAKELGLVDEIGGLSAATAHAAERAKLGDSFRVTEFPRKKQFGEALAESFGGKRREAETALAGPLGGLLAQVQAELARLAEYNDPRGAYARLPFELGLE
ncbi:MAG TPA: signal peptide peptidase SppA [Opitutaceae bacterium]|nr:signal peptide peptidase SppA [Opitutaceae bacterium]